MAESNYSVEGNYNINEKIVFEERIYHEATSAEEAVKMAKKDGNIGSGMVFHNLGISEECKLRKSTLGELFLIGVSKN